MTRILLVDANDEESAKLDRALRLARECDVVRAGSVLDAIRIAGEGTFDAAVLDADLPDGSGLEILDFLRIGSPGIQIVLLSARSGEEVALHALSHGASDLLRKDGHLERELPGRLCALLDRPSADVALVETLAAAGEYEPLDLEAPRDVAMGTGAIETALAEIVAGSVLAAGVWDMRGRAIAAKAPPGVDGDGVGFALATLHTQVGALWTHGNLKPTGYRLIIEVEGGFLAVTAIPGTYIVALLVDAQTSPRRAIERVDQAGLKLLAALQKGRGGGDLTAP